jgi:predicted TIM-barrel fold metal-dependent hydrolase
MPMTVAPELEANDRISLLDRTVDVDAHEFAPPHLWGAVFGPAAARMAPVCEPFAAMMGEDYMVLPHLTGDDMPMTLENVWGVRSTGAPGAFDMRRRLEVMDLMGVTRQLIFPSFGLFAQILATLGEGGGAVAESMQQLLGGGLSPQEAQRLGWAGIDEYNEWAIRCASLDPDRLRPVGILKQARDVGELVAQAQSLIDRGLRGLLINTGLPPAEVSPAAHALDPFWALLAERNVPILAHVGGDLGFLGSSRWSNAEAFIPSKMGLEVGIEPYSYATLHLCAAHWLTVMVMGGVFERHPGLRCGAIELGGHWLGPLADSLDMWATTIFARRMKPIISKKPSAYLARNVRVTPHNIVEPIAEFMTRYPHLSSCYCYATDYPHLEGGMHIKTKVYETLKPLGEEVLERYFVTNGQWLLPE